MAKSPVPPLGFEYLPDFNFISVNIRSPCLKDYVADKTNWRKMLQGTAEAQELEVERDSILRMHVENAAGAELPGTAIEDAASVEIQYPVDEYPTKIVSHNFDKKPVFEGTLQGIKGQYLILDTGVVNVRTYGGYHLELS